MKTDNTIELLGHYGGDIEHACSAWTSTSRDLDAVDPKTGKTKRERMPEMLKTLANAGHHTPFEKSALHFLLTCEQASHIHLLKHRIGVSINGESARYKELKGDRFYLPRDWPRIEQSALEDHCIECFARYHNTLERLETAGISRKRAKESARFYLPYASQIQLDVQFNWRSFVYFLSLRNKPNAQDEIHAIASAMLMAVESIAGNPFKYSIQAFGL